MNSSSRCLYFNFELSVLLHSSSIVKNITYKVYSLTYEKSLHFGNFKPPSRGHLPSSVFLSLALQYRRQFLYTFYTVTGGSLRLNNNIDMVWYIYKRKNNSPKSAQNCGRREGVEIFFLQFFLLPLDLFAKFVALHSCTSRNNRIFQLPIQLMTLNRTRINKERQNELFSTSHLISYLVFLLLSFLSLFYHIHAKFPVLSYIQSSTVLLWLCLLLLYSFLVKILLRNFYWT